LVVTKELIAIFAISASAVVNLNTAGLFTVMEAKTTSNLLPTVSSG
jgi:hypothetical protein